jgi:hypothetical protein
VLGAGRAGRHADLGKRQGDHPQIPAAGGDADVHAESIQDRLFDLE